MQYVGIHTQQVRNNLRSVMLLFCFPLIILLLVWVFFLIIAHLGQDPYYPVDVVALATAETLHTLPWVAGVVGVWFLIAYFTNTAMVRSATGARPLERRENPRVYNIVENLCIAGGMPMPKVNVIDTPMLNAFASGIDDSSYTVTVTTGICQCLDDEELAGVIAHELTHIRNRDTRLLIISIVFVGIMSALVGIAFRMLWNGMIFGTGGRRSNDREGNGGVAVIVMFAVAAVLAALGYFFTLLSPFPVSASIWPMPEVPSCAATRWRWPRHCARSVPPPCRQLPDARMWHSFSSSMPRSRARVLPVFSVRCLPHIPLPKAVSVISSSSELRHLPDGSAKILYVPPR